MKLKFTTLILFILFIADAFAGHLNGGHINYRFLGNSKFEISLYIYRDCQGTGSTTFPFTATCSSNTTNFTLPFISVNDITDVANLPGVCGSYCVAKGNYGYVQYLFQGVVDFSSFSCCEIELQCGQAGRVGISTASTSSQLYLDAKVNKCLGSSMSWTDIHPQLLLLTGQDQILNFSANDTTDYDSISYKLVSAYQGAGSAAAYTAPYSATKPLTFLGFPNANLSAPAGLQFDTIKGNLRFRPTVLNQTAVIAVEMTEWRKVSNVWTKVGSSRREQVVTTIAAGTNNNTLQNSQDNFDVCAGDTSAIVIDISDFSTSDSFEVNISHNVKWASASLLTGPTSRKVLVRLYTGNITDNLKANAFTLEVKDYACPVRGRSVKTYGIKTGTQFIDSTIFAKSAVCTRVKFKAQQRMQGAHFSYTWVLKGKNTFLERTADSAEVFVSDTGWIKAEVWVVSKQHCNLYKYTDSIFIGPQNFLRPFAGNDSSFCHTDSIVLNGIVTGGTAPFTYEWVGKGMGQQVKVALQSGLNLFSLKVTDSNKCVAADGVRIMKAKPAVAAVQNGFVSCQPKKADFIVTDTIPGGQVINNIFTDSAYSINTDTYIAVRESYMFTDTLGCTATDTSLILISAIDVSVPSNMQVCAGDTFVIQPVIKRANRPLTYTWSEGSTDSILVKLAPSVIGNYTYSLNLKDKLGCSKTTSPVMVKVVKLPNVLAPSLPPTCSSYTSVSLSSYGTPQGGVWSGADVLGNNFNASSAGAGSHFLRYTYTDSLGCDASALTSIVVIIPPVASFTASANTVLPGTNIIFTNQSTGSPFLSAWTITGPATQTTLTTHNASFIFTNQGEYDVKLKVDDGICPADSMVKPAYIRVGSNYFSVKEAKEGDLKVYPNPATDKLYIEAKKPIREIIVTDMAGKRIASSVAVQGQAAIVSRTNEAAGVYLLEVITEGQSYSIKFVWE